jgi:hypothetical protein
MINTGVTPPRPATIEVGVSTNPTTLMDQATYTEVGKMTGYHEVIGNGVYGIKDRIL